jgi:uncharacterized protein (TIGR02757 family)
MNQKDLKEYLDFKAEQYECPSFIENDPIQIPHRYSKKEDIEISAFLMATLAWGNRLSILKSGDKLMEIFGNAPYDFIMDYDSLKPLPFVHRTFNGIDLNFFCRSLKNLYQNNAGLEGAFGLTDTKENGLQFRISNFRSTFLETTHEQRSEKHISNPLKNSACKRLVMFLRWMVRSKEKGVDFGIWENISKSELYVPLDVHTGNVARNLGILKRKQNDWKTNEELINRLRKMDVQDPAKYDFALFGVGVNKEL